MGCGATSSDATVTPEAIRSGTMPPPASVLSLERVQVLCVLSADGRFDRLQLQSSLCDAAVAVTRQDASLPVQMIGVGDPQLMDPSALTILVQASLGRIGDTEVLTLAVRPYQARFEQSAIFGPPPITLPFSDEIDGAVVRALKATIQPILAWRADAAA